MLSPEPVTSPAVPLAAALWIPRQPAPEEVPELLALFAEEVRRGQMLPRNAEEVSRCLDDWRVAVADGAIVGCVSLIFFNAELCELRSLAVAPEQRQRGIAAGLIEAAVDLARARGMRRVLTLTRRTGLFERSGFQRQLVEDFPEKVWRDCTPCPLRECCDEVALVYPLEPQPVTAGR
jgi:amino-acid N-acetyltransferase